ncbi:hypothetical protein [Methylobacterium nodulans]|uniref:Uncharacterized protein n=1 Tax=Methylobacterium nodulans (strain LMG 21967 / CNCM I-2342 / ORS 2060) TaxID=460265 RepID=B8IQN1_METNO|nr:hypothetical protein [Methylobacterium nodulans]ACL60543.1 hypothetical protein Mnod_5713 [Methylobacterium nodulans ORS 2060]
MGVPDFAAEERLLHQLEREIRAMTERVKQMLREKGRPDLLAELERNLRDVETGVSQARSAWHSISPAQRRVLEALGDGRRLVREGSSRTVYEAHGKPHALRRVARLATVRNLAARGLVDWDGGAFDPERRAVLSERGRFVLAKGRPGSL